MAIRGRGRPKALTLGEICMRDAAENNKEVKPGSGLKELKRRYANKQKRGGYQIRKKVKKDGKEA